MEQYSIRITRQARGHLLEIRRYIEKELLAPMAAKNTIWINEEKKTVQIISVIYVKRDQARQLEGLVIE